VLGRVNGQALSHFWNDGLLRKVPNRSIHPEAMQSQTVWAARITIFAW
jgi:hypothetical protein